MEEFVAADIWSIAEAVAPDETRRAHLLYKQRAEMDGTGDAGLGAAEAELASELDSLLKREQGRADSLLRQVSPVVALKILANGGQSHIPALRMLSHHVGLGRFLWALAVGASGEDDAEELAIEYLECSSRWATFSFLSSLMRTQEGLPLSVALSSDFESVRRQMPSQTRFGWVSRLVLEGAVHACRVNPQKFGPLGVLISEDATFGMFDYLEHGFYVDSHLDMLRLALEVDEATQSLMKAMSVKSGSLSDHTFARLVLGTKAEVFPFVDFEDGWVVAIAGREAMLATEVALFELARRQLPDSNSHGDFYEEVLEYCLRQVAPSDLAVLWPPINVSVAGVKDPGEVDFAITSESTVVVGEAKAYLFPRDVDAVANAFGTQIAKASDQLRKRTQALVGGSAMTSAQAAGSEQQVQTHAVDRSVRGIGAPLHAYATAIWNRDALDAIDAFDERLAIIPIHQLLVVMSLLDSSDDLDAYLKFRHALMAAEVQVLDELDVLRVYLTDASEALERVRSFPKAMKPLLRGASVSHGAAIALKRPRSRTFWRASFGLLVSPIHLAAPQ